VPYYIFVYLNELKKQYKEVVLLTSNKDICSADLEKLRLEGIEIIVEKNEGFDFGLWYKAFQKFDVSVYDKIVLVNDSCILFKSLDEFVVWSNNDLSDLQGMTISEAVALHVQSYFLVLNRKAVSLLVQYFKIHGICHRFIDVIRTYEIGFSSYLTENGLSLASFIDNGGYTGWFSPYYFCIDYHLNAGIPVIKKKVLFSSYRKGELISLARMGFNIDVEHYYRILNGKHFLIIDLIKLRGEFPLCLDRRKIFQFNCLKFLIRCCMPLYPLYRFLKTYLIKVGVKR
jgi:lipopolysaccharide biosynthesis protein